VDSTTALRLVMTEREYSETNSLPLMTARECLTSRGSNKREKVEKDRIKQRDRVG